MKLSLLAFAASVASAASTPAEVFIFDPAATNTDASPKVSPEVARLVLAHRLREAPDEFGPGIPESVSAADLDAQINAYGKPRQSLFSTQRTQREPQLVILIEGATQDGMRDVQAALDGVAPAFTVPEPPSEEANHDLVANDFSDFVGPWVGPHSCPIDLAINAHEDRCWNGDALVVKYDANKDPETISILASSIPQLRKWASTGELETTLVILPETSRIGSVDRWAPHPSKVSRRQKETVMEFSTPPSSASATPTPATDASSLNDIDYSPNPNTGTPRWANSQCFESRNQCGTQSFGCFRHGVCKEVVEGESCWKCQCGSTMNKYGVKTDWTGKWCQKADVSTEFWMFLGVALLALVSFGGAMSLLMSAGYEPLPGVLGAGVVKSK